jgi:hypothetical protein
LNVQKNGDDARAADPPRRDLEEGAKLLGRQQKSHRLVALADLDL